MTYFKLLFIFSTGTRKIPMDPSMTNFPVTMEKLTVNLTFARQSGYE